MEKVKEACIAMKNGIMLLFLLNKNYSFLFIKYYKWYKKKFDIYPTLVYYVLDNQQIISKLMIEVV
ncbi:hypothetical protein CSCA_0388 [Clostridium scatologenes]|uniref:Uncharacterized protein n=1 Tax=Clostridium scatologenes TaxID=1548 RepID=A0A0E3M7U5_CLOSL|nr:hypothetical protein CSCA_0388 [Clostridium scatologenes]